MKIVQLHCLLLGLLVSSSITAASTPSTPTVSPDSRPTRDTPHAPWTLEEWCSHLRGEIKKLHWSLEPCTGIQWKIGGRSVLGKPLPVAEFGDEKATNTTLVVSMIHSDENTPLYLGLKLAHYLAQNEESLRKKSIRVVLAPMINPDGFFRKTKTRTNAHKVDLNRNLPTRDWDQLAHHLWKTQFQSNARRFPGERPSSEPETLFQQALLAETKPQKILAIHAPLNFMDYDGPTTLSLARFPRDYVQECLRLKKVLKATPGGFFPGSLGNYAGQEKGIPTLTLELPSANAKKAEIYWTQFEHGIRNMIEFQVPEVAAGRLGVKEVAHSESRGG